MNCGIYPMVSLVQAREKRNEAPAILAEGKDPAIEKKLAVEANRKAAECTIKKIAQERSEEHTSQVQSLRRISYAVVYMKKKNHKYNQKYEPRQHHTTHKNKPNHSQQNT